MKHKQRNKKHRMARGVVLVLAVMLVFEMTGCWSAPAPTQTTPTTTAGSEPTTALTVDPTTQPTMATEPTMTESTQTEPPEKDPDDRPGKPDDEPTEPVVTDPPTTEPEETKPSVTFTEVDETVYATDKVNVRTGPGTGYKKIGSLNAGEAVRRIGVGSNGWSKVIFDDKEAYVSSNYLTTTKPHTHNYQAGETVAPTCTEKGYTRYTCSCGDSYKGEKTDALGHDYEVITVEPTESSKGYTEHVCCVCGYRYKDQYTDKQPSADPEPTEDTRKPIQEADPETGISWDGKSPIIYTYEDGSTGTEPRDGATYEVWPGIYRTYKDPNKETEPTTPPVEQVYYCDYCGRIDGDGSNGTCVRWWTDGNHTCECCGATVPGHTCHTCGEN